jgi:hypothetical protein
MENRWPVAGYYVAPGRSVGNGNPLIAGNGWEACRACFAVEKDNAQSHN